MGGQPSSLCFLLCPPAHDQPPSLAPLASLCSLALPVQLLVAMHWCV